MSPADFTNDILIAWGGPDVFNQALRLAQGGGVLRAEWDDANHVIRGEISTANGYPMKTSLEVLDDGTIIPHCPCITCQKYGQTCPHVVALGIHQMVTYMPEDADEPEEDAAEMAARAIPDDARIVPDVPKIVLKLSGSRASLRADAWARYGAEEVPCGGAADVDAIRRQDPDDPDLWHVRNPDYEQSALAILRGYGFGEGESRRRLRYGASGDGEPLFITEPREVLNFLGGGVPYLRRLGWRIDLSDRLMAVTDEMPMIVPVVKIRDVPGRDSFDVGYTFDAGGHDVSQAEIQAAINRGDNFIMTGSATLLIDADAVNAMRDVFADCAARQAGADRGFFRVSGLYAPYVKGALESLDAIDLDADDAPDWRANAAARNRDEGARFEPVDLGRLEGTLRPYQKQGVYWMRFLERSGLSGLLADEMGLGKTLQTLAWLSLERHDPAARGKPALIVCPTSLVRNWEAEAAKFTPWLKRLVISGAERARAFREIPRADLVVTSYALIQRDLEAGYLDKQFSVIVLDEAQHIKNRETRNAKSVKLLTAAQKLVLTGTPVENSVADVWSIFDFLLPDYLGEYAIFRDTTEIPAAQGGREGHAALEKLHHKLHPFILRRLKRDVAKDLPDKVTKTVYAPLTAAQQRLANELRAKAKAATTKFQMLAVLMRLRQIANSAELVAEDAGEGAAASGKIDVFFETLGDLMRAGHRTLVFSQFVKMLTLLRRELDRRHIPYCYLDGATKDRLGECRRFNRGDAPVFLISLMAGGTGLNLTGADTVIHFDPWWNPAVENQATDRAHRIGQKKTVCVVKMISQDSVEERVLELQEKKKLVIDATVGTTDEAVVSKMTFDDLRGIIGI